MTVFYPQIRQGRILANRESAITVIRGLKQKNNQETIKGILISECLMQLDYCCASKYKAAIRTATPFST